jgi:sRNA-binding carbon storage regulator CsrA
MIDGGSTVMVIEIRVAEIRLGIEVPEEILLRQIEERPVAAWLG